MWTAWALLVIAGVLALAVVLRSVRPNHGPVRTRWAVLLMCLLTLAAAFGVLGRMLESHLTPVPLVMIASVAAATLGGGPIAEAIFRWAAFRHDREAGTPNQGEGSSKEVNDDVESDDAGEPILEDEPVLRGGLWIGFLERGAIAATLWSGWPEGLAVVLAVKGLGRFTELKQHAAAEQFILGTFASVLWACAAYGVGRLLVGP